MRARCAHKLQTFPLIGIVAAVVLLVAGCGEASIFLPNSGFEDGVSVRMSESGAVVAEDSVDVYIDVAPGHDALAAFDEVRVLLVDDGGTEHANTRYSRDDLGADRRVRIDVTVLPPGLYRVDVTVSRDGTDLLNERRHIYVVREAYRIEGLSLYPPTLHPTATGIFLVNLSVPDGSDPYIRWSLGGEVFASGYSSDGFGEVRWTAPERESVYRMRVEIFPQAPPADRIDSFSSNVAEVADIVVSRSRSARESVLGPADRFFSLYRLQGDLRDDGLRGRVAPENVRARPFGDVDLRVEGASFGYMLNGHSGFESPGMAVPFIGSALAPFSLHARLVPDFDFGAGDIFYTESDDESYRVSLHARDEGGLELRLRTPNGEGSTRPGIPLLEPGIPAWITVSVSPSEERTVVLWFLDGRLVSISELAVPVPDSPIGRNMEAPRVRLVEDDSNMPVRPGTTRIGARNRGFVGLVDEIGVYFRDSRQRLSTDEAVFRNAMESRYSGRLAYARGFEGLFLPGELETVGRVTIQQGALELAPGSRVHFPAFLFDDEQLIVEIELGENAAAADGVFRFSLPAPNTGADDTGGPPGTVLFEARSDGRIELNGETVGSVSLDGPPILLLRLDHTPGLLQVRGPGDVEIEIELDVAQFDGIELGAHHPDDRTIPLRITTVLAHRDRVALAERLDFSATRSE